MAETNPIVNINPLLTSPANDDFTIPVNSPAAGNGMLLNEPEFDFLQQAFANPPSIGAIEANPVSGVSQEEDLALLIFPNPAGQLFQLLFPASQAPTFPLQVQVWDLSGRQVFQQTLDHESDILRIGHLPKSIYVVRAGRFTGKLVLKG